MSKGMTSLNIKKPFSSRSDRVKSVDIHPTESWILSSLYNGNVYIYDYETQQLVKQFEVTDLPVRCAKFIARKQWMIAGADDMHIRVYNLNTMDTVTKFEAHQDYIRSLAVHPNLPYVLSSSDDMSIKLFDWSKNWETTQIFEGHAHYVMMVVFNPKDPNTFASASLDRTIKVWGLGSPTPHFTLNAHEKGVNCIEYFSGGDKPYLVSGADDRTVKVWDYQNKTCVSTLEGHAHNISAVCFHPELPLIITGSEDGTIRLWNSNTYREERKLMYNWDRVWCLGFRKGSNCIAIGYDEGTVLISLGREEPAVSMDQNGKIIWAKHNEVLTANIKSGLTRDTRDGEKIGLSTKEFGSCEIYPQHIEHSPKGRFVVAVGDGEYIIYTAVAWRNKSYGNCVEFVWSNLNAKGQYCVREVGGRLRVFANFKEVQSFSPEFGADNLYGGSLIGVKTGPSISFYDWKSTLLVRKIEVSPTGVYWNDNNLVVAITTSNSFYILKYNRNVVQDVMENHPNRILEDGIEDAFEVLHEIPENVKTATWVGDCFIYTTDQNRLNYAVGGKIETVAHLDKPLFLLGYIPRYNKLFLMNKKQEIVSYTLHLSIVLYQTAILRQDFDDAAKILPKIPQESLTKIAHFLESQGYLELALSVSTDKDHCFELAVKLGLLERALAIAKEHYSEHKWKRLADLAIADGDLNLAEECFVRAEDVGGLLLLYTSTGNKTGVEELVEKAKSKGKNNIAFSCLFLLGRLEECLNLLINTGRIPEAALMARSYLPSHLSRVVEIWKNELAVNNPITANQIANPDEYENLFPELRDAVKAQGFFRQKHYSELSASHYLQVKGDSDKDLVREMKEMEASGNVPPPREESSQKEESPSPKENPSSPIQQEEESNSPRQQEESNSPRQQKERNSPRQEEESVNVEEEEKGSDDVEKKEEEKGEGEEENIVSEEKNGEDNDNEKKEEEMFKDLDDFDEKDFEGEEFGEFDEKELEGLDLEEFEGDE